MSPITQQHLPYLFEPLSNYGLRGNSAFWTMLHDELQSRPFLVNAHQLVEWVIKYARDKIVDCLHQEMMLHTYHSTNEWVAQQAGCWDLFYLGESSDLDKQQISQALRDTLSNFLDDVLQNEKFEGEIYVSAFYQGGMSGGLFCLSNWHHVLLSTLKKRAELLEQSLAFIEKTQSRELYFVGDVHGRFDKLEVLINEICWAGGEEKLVFVGDLIDNQMGENAEYSALLRFVKNKVEKGDAFCLLGNHELNAIGWWLRNEKGENCRQHSEKNRRQHEQFLQQVGEGSVEHREWIEWFQTLPLYLDFGVVTAIHACWHEPSIEKLKPYLNEDNSLKSEHWLQAFDENHELYGLLETLLKGPEVTLPEGHTFLDKSNIQRSNIRAAWWNDSASTYRELAVVPPNQLPCIPATELDREARKINGMPERPVVVGHYTLRPTAFPQKLSKRVACVDFNGAKANHPLVALYVSTDLWPDSIDDVLSEDSFCFVGEVSAERQIVSGIQHMLESLVTACPSPIENENFSVLVNQTLLIQWDPVGIYDPDDGESMLADEYADYLLDVVTLAQSRNHAELATYLYLVEKYLIGVERDNAERVSAQVAEALILAWQENTESSDFF